MAQDRHNWAIDLIPRDGNSSSPVQRFMDLKFSSDFQSVTVSRLGPNGQVQSFDMPVETEADITRLFAAEALAVIATQANRNFVDKGLGTTMATPVTFSDAGNVLCEINRGGKMYRRLTFDPNSCKLTVEAEGGAILFSQLIKRKTDIPLEAARLLGVKLPLGSR